MPRKILIVAPAWVGDMVMSHTLVQCLLRQDQQDASCEIHMLAPPATAPVGERLPGVSQVHTLDVAHGELGMGERRRIAGQMKTMAFDQAIVLPNSFKSALVPWFAGIPTRTGWSGEARWGVLNDRRKLDRDALPLMIERFMALAFPPGHVLSKPYPVPQLDVDENNKANAVAEFGLNIGQPVMALCPGAEFGPAKRWPTDHYAAVGRHHLATGGQVWLFGSPKDRADCDAIADILGPQGVQVLAGATDLKTAIDLLSLANVVVCNDSGLMHIAAALGRRVIAVYGSTSPDFTPPLGEDVEILRLGLACSPCFQRTCPLDHLNCLNELSPQRVIACL